MPVSVLSQQSQTRLRRHELCQLDCARAPASDSFGYQPWPSPIQLSNPRSPSYALPESTANRRSSSLPPQSHNSRKGRASSSCRLHATPTRERFAVFSLACHVLWSAPSICSTSALIATTRGNARWATTRMVYRYNCNLSRSGRTHKSRHPARLPRRKSDSFSQSARELSLQARVSRVGESERFGWRA